MSFSYEKLDVYRLLTEVADWIADAKWPSGSHWLKDQALRSIQSAVLNTAEGLLRKGKAGKNQLDIAFASAGEANAALRLSRLEGAEEQQAKLRRVGQMLWRLKR